MAFREKDENCFNEKSVKDNFVGIAYKLAQKITFLQVSVKCIYALSGIDAA